MIRKLLAGLAIAAATLAPGLMQNAHASPSILAAPSP